MEQMETWDSTEPDVVTDTGSLAVPIVDHMTDSLELKGNLTVLQAHVLLEDAYHFRTVHHKLDASSLRLYRFYHSLPVQLALGFTLTLIHLLAFLEWPSSLSWNSDLRRNNQRIDVPCWLTQTLEIVALLVLLLDCSCKVYFFGQKRTIHNPWLLCYLATLTISIIDWMISTSYGCQVFRFRRFLRPLFLLQHSSIMKKTIKCLRNSVSEVISVLVFLAVLIYMFTLIGMCIFPAIETFNSSIINAVTTAAPVTTDSSAWNIADDTSPNATANPAENTTTIVPPKPPNPPTSREGEHYFRDFWTSLFSLLVLVTTANHPDVMMPIYNVNRIYALYFIIFVVIGLFCLTNMLTAVVFNQFRGYFQTSIQTQLFRRRVGFRAAYSVLVRGRNELTLSLEPETISDEPVNDPEEDGIPVQVLRRVIPGTKIPLWKRELMMADLRSRCGCVLDYAQFHEVLSHMDDLTRPFVEARLPWRPGRVARTLQKIFISRWFDRFGMLVCLANIVVITVEVALRYDIVFGSNDVELEYINAVFIAFYLVEQICKLWANGFYRHMSQKWNVLDLFLTIVLVMMELIQIIFTYAKEVPIPNNQKEKDIGLSFWDGARIVNLLIVIRFLRIVPRINSIRMVGSTIRDLAQNLKSFAGVLVAAYYIFGLLGMELFGGRIKYQDLLVNNTKKFSCGSYAQLKYWSNNFDDFAASIVVLWDIMVVNNWQVIVEAYATAVGQWSRVYFVVWWLVSVLVILNLVVALIIENFIQRWDKNFTSNGSDSDRQELFQSMSLYAMFKSSLQEPPQEELVAELKMHPEFSDFISSS